MTTDLRGFGPKRPPTSCASGAGLARPKNPGGFLGWVFGFLLFYFFGLLGFWVFAQIFSMNTVIKLFSDKKRIMWAYLEGVVCCVVEKLVGFWGFPQSFPFPHLTNIKTRGILVFILRKTRGFLGFSSMRNTQAQCVTHFE